MHSGKPHPIFMASLTRCVVSSSSAGGDNHETFTKEKLSDKSLVELQTIADHLRQEVTTQSQEAVHLLVSRDRHRRRWEHNCQQMTLSLKQSAREYGLDTKIKFSFCPQDGHQQEWLQGWVVLSHTPRGVPKQWRTRLWTKIADQLTTAGGSGDRQWDVILANAEKASNELAQRVTGSVPGDDGVERKRIVRVLMAYAVANEGVHYTEHNSLVATITRAVGGREIATLKVLSCLLQHRIPRGYYSGDLSDLSVDMAVLRDLLSYILPDLSAHLTHLRSSSASFHQSYSSSSPPLPAAISPYEPPLLDAFSLNWLPVLLTSVLPHKAARRVIDGILVEGSQFLLYACIAVWAVFERHLLEMQSITACYCKTTELVELLHQSKLISSSDYMRVLYTLLQSANSLSIPSVLKLRRRRTSSGSKPYSAINCPPPSMGGGLLTRMQPRSLHPSPGVRLKMADPPSSPGGHIQLDGAVGVAAFAVCPQNRGANRTRYTNVYAADVPVEVLQHYPMMEGTKEVMRHSRKFTLSVPVSSS